MERTMNIHKSENERSSDIVTAVVANLLTKRVSYSRQLSLFPEEEFETSATTNSEIIYEYESVPTDTGIHNLNFMKKLEYSSHYSMPIVKPYNGDIPEYLVALYRLQRATHIQKGVCPMFYTSDKNFEWVWDNVARSVKTLQRFEYTASTDFSVYADLNPNVQCFNILRNKVMAAIWQYYGLKVIPSVTWTTLKYIERDLDGWPTDSVILINSTGIGHDARAKAGFRDCYEAAIDILKPSFILRYGARQEGEMAEISRYYPNNNKMFNLFR